jgi:hypothetical protein
MAKQFPKTLFVKVEGKADEEYFVADDNSYVLAEMGETIKIATYQLVEISDAKVLVEFTKPKRRR